MQTLMIAVAGKGGCGKSTVAALSACILTELGISPLLAVDADPAGMLGAALGMEVCGTVADLREELRDAEAGGEEGKARALEAGLARLVSEGDKIDLLTMGRPTGRGCYCFINHALAEALGRLAGQYRTVIVDNEAGMEHLARGNLPRVDLLLLVAEPSPAAITVAIRALSAVQEAGTSVSSAGLILNRMEDGQSLPQSILPAELPIWARLPQDAAITQAWANGEPLTQLVKISYVGRILADFWRSKIS